MRLVCERCGREQDVEPPPWVVSGGRGFKFRCSGCGATAQVGRITGIALVDSDRTTAPVPPPRPTSPPARPASPRETVAATSTAPQTTAPPVAPPPRLDFVPDPTLRPVTQPPAPLREAPTGPPVVFETPISPTDSNGDVEHAPVEREAPALADPPVAPPKEEPIELPPAAEIGPDEDRPVADDLFGAPVEAPEDTFGAESAGPGVGASVDDLFGPTETPSDELFTLDIAASSEEASAGLDFGTPADEPASNDAEATPVQHPSQDEPTDQDSGDDAEPADPIQSLFPLPSDDAPFDFTDAQHEDEGIAPATLEHPTETAPPDAPKPSMFEDSPLFSFGDIPDDADGLATDAELAPTPRFTEPRAQATQAPYAEPRQSSSFDRDRFADAWDAGDASVAMSWLDDEAPDHSDAPDVPARFGNTPVPADRESGTVPPGPRRVVRQDDEAFEVPDDQTLQRWVGEHRVSADDQLTEDGGATWERLGDRDELQGLFVAPDEPEPFDPHMPHDNFAGWNSDEPLDASGVALFSLGDEPDFPRDETQESPADDTAELSADLDRYPPAPNPDLEPPPFEDEFGVFAEDEAPYISHDPTPRPQTPHLAASRAPTPTPLPEPAPWEDDDPPTAVDDDGPPPEEPWIDEEDDEPAPRRSVLPLIAGVVFGAAAVVLTWLYLMQPPSPPALISLGTTPATTIPAVAGPPQAEATVEPAPPTPDAPPPTPEAPPASAPVPTAAPAPTPVPPAAPAQAKPAVREPAARPPPARTPPPPVPPVATATRSADGPQTPDAPRYAARSFDRMVAEGWDSVDSSASRAVSSFEGALQQRPGDAAALYGLGYALLKAGRPDEALGPLCRAASSPRMDISREVRGVLRDKGLRCPGGAP
jgi:hypothetical protein